MERVWFHVTWGTYGSWLPGDPRGFRDHDHRVHSSGTYDNPPPAGEHRLLHGYARAVQTRECVVLAPAQRATVLGVVLAKAGVIGVNTLAVSVSGNHVHLLGKFEEDRVGVEVGMLKRESSKVVRGEHPGGLWSRRCHPRRVRDREHQRKSFYYILDHARGEGAAVWSFLGEGEGKGQTGGGA